MNDIIKKFNKSVDLNNRIFTINKIHGVNVCEQIIQPFLEYYNKKIKILVAGVEMQRLLDHYNIEYEKITDYFIKKRKKNGYEFKLKENDTTSSVTIIWSANFIDTKFINKIAVNFKTLVVAIGDSFLVDYFSNGKISDFLNNYDYYIDDIKKIPKYSQELIYFTNRIRKGVLEELENIDNRSYIITDKKPEIEQLFEYDIAVVSKFYIGSTNNYIRKCIFKYDSILPKKGERMAAYEIITAKDKDGNTITIQIGEELIVKDIQKDNNGITNGKFKYKNKEVSLGIDLQFIANMLGIKNKNYTSYGNKIFYSYAIPPMFIIDKSYDTVFFEMKNNDINNKRVFYSVARATRRKMYVAYNSDARFVY